MFYSLSDYYSLSGQPELMTPAKFVRMYEKPSQVTLDGGQFVYIYITLHTVLIMLQKFVFLL